MSAAAGYSGTLLPKKLDLKDGQAAALTGLPHSLQPLEKSREFTNLDRRSDWSEITGNGYENLHVSTESTAAVEAATPALRARIKRDGMIWISWPKETFTVSNHVTEDVIRKEHR